MKSVLQILTAFLLCLSFGYAQEATIELDFVERHELPGISIRAIEVTKADELWFAGSKGRVGRIKNGGLLLDSISHAQKYPGFRSIAYNGDHIFVLSIENPALLFRLEADGEGISAELVYKEEHEKVFYDSMTFMSHERGIAMGDPIDGCLSVILTEDGGKTWQKLSCKNLPEAEIGEAAFAASNTNLASVGHQAWMVSGGKKARVWRSSDYGKNWEAVNTPMQQGQNMTGIFTAAFYDGQQGLIMGGNWEEKKNSYGTKARTTDGGQTWDLVSDGQAPGYISCVQYLPGSKGRELMAVSTEGIYYSKNAGENWRKISSEGFYSLRFSDANTAWLSGNEQIIKVKIKRKQ